MHNTLCEYDKNIKRAYEEHPNLCITHAHITSWLPQFLATKVDGRTIRDDYQVLIIDENPVKCFLNEMIITREELRFTRQCMVQTHLPEQLIILVDALLQPEIPYDSILHMDLSTLSVYTITRKFSEGIAEMLQQHAITVIPHNILNFLFELMKHRNPCRITHMIYYRENILNLTYFNDNALQLGLRILALDGTANKLVWREMLGSDNIHGVDYRYNNAWQVNAGRYSIGSWRFHGNLLPLKLCGFIDRIAAIKKRNVLIVGTKAVCGKVQKFTTATNLEYAIYYNLRSRNEYYKTCDTVILACEPNPPQEKIDSCVSVSGWAEEVWRIIFRDEEMLQAVGRIRQNIAVVNGVERESPEVIIFPNTGIDKSRKISNLMPEAHIISLDNLDSILTINGFMDEKFCCETVILMSCPSSQIHLYEIVEKMGIPMTRFAVNKYIQTLLRDGIIKDIGKKVYDLTTDGYQRLSIAKTRGECFVKGEEVNTPPETNGSNDTGGMV